MNKERWGLATFTLALIAGAIFGANGTVLAAGLFLLALWGATTLLER